ncbi:MAG: alanine--tRNA ligase [Holosporaceae bacterium]|jgi:alanyl-tRNA synthetase|nr:alanine--tRNA ligase [Holosporaceae bacterium]
MLSSDIRASFLKFFETNGHQAVESASLVPQNDPSLLFTNSGMVQFKKVFTGLETRNYSRATTAQKCLRAGGKHNDLDQVGFTARHHTFFEMLGNFSFGDYFKEDAINFAWTFLTKELGLPRNKLLATVYHTDEEAASIWKKVAGDICVIPISTSDNFWSMGDVGPCGPCSEIFYDHGENVPGGMPGTPDQDGDRYMEIWNIVFMQFEQIQNGERVSLGKKSIDTGMGLERIGGIMQGVVDNYQIDLFQQLINEIKTISKTNFENTRSSYKVIADHIRSISFLIADGILPSNEGRGYVLRRILRRAMRHGNLINIKNPFLFKLSDLFVDSMKDAYPELEKARATIAFTIHMEEEKFLTTLERGLKILQNDAKEIPSGGILRGDAAFKLYDTYGFPLDLTQDILKSKNISVDVEGFNAALLAQKNRALWIGSGETPQNFIWHNLKEKIKSTEFIGYEKEKKCSEILAIVQEENEVPSVSSGKAFLLIKSTPFYAECGGQCGDVGVVKSKTGVFKVTNAKKFCDEIIVHEGEVVSGYFKNSDDVELEIDVEKRRKISANHTATHLLHAALRLVLGKHVIQRGSSLNEDRLRFDFSHDSAVSSQEILKIEKIVNGWILRDLKVTCHIMSKNEAISSGALALFGEKYGDRVRIISIFDENDKNKYKISDELCGGTHASSTGKIGLFKILSETSVGSGIRRMEAITGEKILEYLGQTEKTIDSIAEKLKCDDSNLLNKIDDLLAEIKHKNLEISLNKQKTALEKIQKFPKTDAVVYSLIVSDCDADELRSLHDVVKSKNPSGIIVIACHKKGRISLIVGVSPDLQSRYDAVKLLKCGLVPLDGKGGGNATFARGGGSGDGNKMAESVQLIIDSVN